MTEHFTTNEDVVDLRVDDLEGTFEPSPQVIEPFPGDLPGAVRWLTQRGFALFPVKLTTVVKGGKVKLDKKPLGCWSAISSKEADYVMELLRSRQGAPWNVKEGLALGMDCGESDAFILDVDVRNGAPGMESLAVLEAKYGKLPLTWVSRTPSGGLHYWFRGHGRNSASSKELGAGLDTRGDGGLIVIPPSIADDGTTYTWVNAPDQVALADAPEWLIELTRKQEQPQNSSEGGCVGGFAPGIDFDEEIFEGSRNNDLFKRACRLRAEGWEKDGLFAAIWEVNQRKCHPPIDKDEVWTIVNSAMEYDPNEAMVRNARDARNLADLSVRIQQQMAEHPILTTNHINRLAAEGLKQEDPIRHVEGELVDDDPVGIDWDAYVNDAIATGAVENILDENFLAHFTTLWETEKTLALELRKRLVNELPAFDVVAFNTAIKAFKDKMAGAAEAPPKAGDDLPEGAIVAPVDVSLEFIDRCLNSRLKESNMLLQQQMLTHFATCQMNLQADIQTVIGLARQGMVSDTNIQILVDTLKSNADIRKDEEFDIAYRYPFTPLGNATRLAECYYRDHKFCPREGTWLYYENGMWDVDAAETHIKWRATERLTNPVGELTQLVAQPNYNDLTPKEKRYLIRSIRLWAEKNQAPSAIDGALYFAKTYPAFLISPDDFDTQPHLFNVKNGTIDLRAGERHDHKPEDYLRTQADLVYDSEATCPNWEEFIAFALGDKPDVLRTFQQAVGYGLWGTNEAKKFFILFGPTGTGKSQVIATLQKLAGKYGFACPPKTILDRRANDSSNELVDAYSHRMAFVSELSERDRFSEATIKAFTGGTVLSARRLFGENKEFSPPTTLFIDTNEMSHFNINDAAFLERMVVFSFNNRIDEAKKIDGFAEKVLYPELPGILNYAIKGAMDWYMNRFTIPASCRQAVEEIRTDKDRVAEFLKAVATPCPTGVIKASVVWDRYKEWYQSNYNGNMMGSKTFYETLGKIPGIAKHEERNANYYSGYEFKGEVSQEDDARIRHSIACKIRQQRIADAKPE